MPWTLWPLELAEPAAAPESVAGLVPVDELDPAGALWSGVAVVPEAVSPEALFPDEEEVAESPLVEFCEGSVETSLELPWSD